MAILNNAKSPLLQHGLYGMDQIKLLTVWGITALILLFGLDYVKDLIAFVLMKLYQALIQQNEF
jgi:hypothetical protein